MINVSRPTTLLVLLTATAVLAACGEADSARPGDRPPPEVGIVEPLERSVPEWRTYSGRLEAVERVEIRARVTGFVQKVHFREGAVVRRGELLYSLDPRTFEAERSAALARVAEAEARLALARSEVSRVEGLVKSRAVSIEELDRRTRQVESAAAVLAAARADLQRAELDLEFTRVEAPVTGRVGMALVTEGNMVSGGGGDSTVLATMVSLDPIYLEFPIDEPTALRLRQVADNLVEPLPVELQLTGRERFEYEGRLDFIDNRIDQGTGTLLVRAVFDNANGDLVPGAFGRARMQLEPPEPSLLVPEKALGIDQTQQVLLVVGEGDVVERRVVTTGPLNDGYRVIRSGIAKGDRVIVEGLLAARPGGKVSPRLLEAVP